MNSRDAELVAAEAWDTSKLDEDPVYAASTKDHQLKLSNAVDDISLHLDQPDYTTGIEGLEHFEEHVVDLLLQARAAEEARKLLTEGAETIEDAKAKREREEAKDPELKRQREEAEAKDPQLKRKREKEEEESAAAAKKKAAAAAAEAKRQAEEEAEEDEEENNKKAKKGK